MKKVFLWPTYFDVGLTKKMGRRVPKHLAVDSPTIEELVTAAKRLGLKPEVEYSKAFPSTPWVKGRVFVSKTHTKQELIRKVASVLKTIRDGQS